MKKSKTEPLEEWELQEVRNYVEEVTKKVYATADLLDRNNYCFKEDKKPFGLSELASITLDATAIAQTVSGPWSAPIALGGTALAGIMQGLDKVVKSRQGYDFEKLEQRQSFVQSLCSYYNYRQEIEHLLFPRRRLGQLSALNRALQENLQGMVAGCEGCKRISEIADKEKLDPRSVQAANQIAAATDRTFVQPLGTYTVQTLSSLRWVDAEVARIQEEMGDDSSIGRDLVSEIKSDLDRFLFEREAPQFIHFQNRKAMGLFQEFSTYVRREGQQLAMLAWPHVSTERFVGLYNMNEPQVVKALASAAPELASKGQAGLAHRIADFERKSVDLLDRTVLAMDVQNSYCSFFQKAGVFNAALQSACEGAMAQAVQRNLNRLEQLRTPGLLGQRQPVEVSVEWAEGLTKMVNRISQDPQRFRRR